MVQPVKVPCAELALALVGENGGGGVISLTALRSLTVPTGLAVAVVAPNRRDAGMKAAPREAKKSKS